MRVNKRLHNFLISIVLIAIFIGVSNNQSFAQNDWKVLFAPYGRHIKDVHVFSSTELLVVGGSEFNDSLQSIFKTSDGGQTWDLAIDLFNPWLLSVSFPNPTLGVAVGYEGTVLRTTDAGNSWNPVTLSGNLATRHYHSVFFLDQNTGFMAGGNQSNDSIQTILKTVDGGITWSNQLDNLGSWLKSIYFPNLSTGFAVGESGTVLKTTDGGTNWNPMTVPVGVSQRDFNSVYFVDSNTGIVVGGNLKNDSIQTIIKTTDGGSTWSIITDAVAPWLNKVSFHSATSGYAVGDEGSILATDDMGDTWVQVALPDSINDIRHLNSLYFANQFFGVMVGNTGKILIYEPATAPAPVVTLQPAVGFGDQKINIYGTVNPNSDDDAAMVELEYGTSMALGNVLPAYPAIAVGLSDVAIIAPINNPLPNTTYYYRLKATNSMGSFYSAIESFYSDPDVILNWDFEIWDSVYIERPDEWSWEGNADKVTSFDGGNAVKLTTDTSVFIGSPGIIIFGDTDGEDSVQVFLDGVPFSERPDSIAAYFNYNIIPGDTALVLCLFKKNGVVISLDWNKITGSSGGSFVRLAFPINFTAPDFPDSLVLGFAGTNPFVDPTAEGSVMMIDKITFPGASQTVPNADFENWTTSGFENARYWSVTNYYGLRKDPLQFPYQKTSDSYSGDYAFEIQNDTINPSTDQGQGIGIALLGYGDTYPIPTFPVYHRPASLHGYYKYFPSSGDTCSVGITLFKNGLQIGLGYFSSDSTATQFTSFTAPIQYSDSTIPDSAYLHIRSSSSYQPPGSTRLVIDALSFDNFMFTDSFVVSISEIPGNNPDQVQMKLYPNPASDLMNIEIQNIKQKSQLVIVDITGRTILDIPIIGNSINHQGKVALNTSGINNGIYIIKCVSMHSTVSSKFLVQH